MLPSRRLLTLNKGVGGYLLNDLFSRYADNAVLQGAVPLVGPAWGTTGATLPTISGGFLIDTTSAALGYLYSILPKAPFVIGTVVNFLGGSNLTTKAMTIAFASNTVPFSLNDLLHLNFGAQSFTLSIRQAGGAFNTVLGGNWVVPMTNDGAPHLIAMAVVGNEVSILDPGGGHWSFSDSRVPSVAGDVCFWEPSLASDGLQARVSQAYASSAGAFVYTPGSPFNPADLFDITLSNNNFTATSGASATKPQVRSLAATANSKVYFEAYCNTVFNPATNGQKGFGISNQSHAFSKNIGGDADSAGWFLGASAQFDVNSVANTVATGGAMQIATLDYLGFAFDFSLKKSWCRNITKNTGWNNDILANQNPATGTGGQDFSAINAGPYYINFELVQIADSFILNSGQMPFAGAVPAGFSNW